MIWLNLELYKYLCGDEYAPNMFNM